MVLLFRIVERESNGGSLCIDGVDTQSVGLQMLRKGMAIVPQEPLLVEV